MTAAPALAASTVSSNELLYLQLEKLAINAVINPLTAVFNCINGDLFNRPPIHNLILALLDEISTVLQRIVSSTTESSTSIARFSLAALEKTVSKMATITAKNVSSMRQDVIAERKTEVDYINGYIFKRGSEFGIDCSINGALIQMVHDRRFISISQINEFFPSATNSVASKSTLSILNDADTIGTR